MATIDVQFAAASTGASATGRPAADLPAAEALRRWGSAALVAGCDDAALTLRVCAADEMRGLNRDWRGVDRPTNVLSFPAASDGWPQPAGEHYLGDIALCAEVIAREAAEQGKPVAAHWAHMVVHGVLHLQGYDHFEAADAEVMEARERAILAGFDYSDPYLCRD